MATKKYSVMVILLIESEEQEMAWMGRGVWHVATDDRTHHIWAPVRKDGLFRGKFLHVIR